MSSTVQFKIRNIFAASLLVVFGSLLITTHAVAEDESRFDELWESSYSTATGVDVSQRISVEDIIEPPGEYRYSSFGRGDPFLPPYIQIVESREIEQRRYFEIPIVSGLQVPLEQLTVEGIWVLPNRERRVMIRTSVRNEGIIAKIGDPIGLAGKIVDITENMVVAREYELHEDGSRTFDDRVLFLGDPEDARRGSARRRVVLKPGQAPRLMDEQNVVGRPREDKARQTLDLEQLIAD